MNGAELDATPIDATWRPAGNPWLIALMVTLAAFMEVLDSTIVNVALPHIAGSMSSSNDESTWVLTSYLVANGIVLLISGFFTRLLGRKRYFLTCIVMFTVCSFLCGIATNLTALIIFRMLQGFFGGGLQPNQQSIILDTFPPEKRTAAFGLTALATIVGPVLGPTLGGVITDNYSWRWIFLINIPVGIIAFFGVSALLEDPPWLKLAGKAKASMDYIGLGFIILGLGTLQVLLDQGENADWFSSSFIRLLALLSVTGIVGAIFWLVYARKPIVNLHVMRDRNFALGCLMISAMAFILYSSAVLLPQLRQNRTERRRSPLMPCFRLLSILVAAAGAAACTVGPNFIRPEPASPSAWHDSAAASPAATITTTADPQPDWWRGFDDPELVSLIQRATAGNFDLKIALQRIAVARSGELSAAAAGMPTLKGSASYTRQQEGLDEIAGQIGSLFPAKLTQAPAAFGLYEGALDTSWEIDLFGKVRRSVEASQADTAASIEDRNDSLVSLQAEVAQTYLRLRAAQASLAAAKADQVTERDLLTLTGNRSTHGLTSSLDVKNAEAALASSEASVPEYEQQTTTYLNSLAVLIGQNPGTLDAELAQAQPIPHLASATVTIGLPSSLARRRPDIRAAEARLHEQTADVGMAIAQLYPDLTLTGEVGQQSQRLKNFSKSYNSIYSLAPSLSLPIFKGGKIRANIAQAKAQQLEALFTYEKTVLTALQDVENALASYRTDQQRLSSYDRAAAADQAAVDIALDRYRQGVSNYLDVLTPQVNLIQVEQQRIQAQLAVTTDAVTLYKALGGGWQVTDDTRR